MPKETNCTIIENEIVPKEPTVGTLYIPLHDFCLGMCGSSWAWSSGSKACGAMRGGEGGGGGQNYCTFFYVALRTTTKG